MAAAPPDAARPTAARSEAALGVALAEVLAGSGARAVRVVDGRTGRVVGAAGDPAGDADASAEVARLLRDQPHHEAAHALVTTDRSVHLLRPTPVPGVFVHLRLDLDRADTGRADRALAAPGLHTAVRRAMAPSPSPRRGAAPGPSGLSRPRSRPVAVPGPRDPGRQPALAALAVGTVSARVGSARVGSGDGLRAAGVLAELIEVGRGEGTLPRRHRGAVRERPAVGVTVGLPQYTWARDADTMRRLLNGLRGLH